MECPSILFEEPNTHAFTRTSPLPRPDCFSDLHLDQIEIALLEDEADDGLISVFRQPLASVRAIRYRQDVFRDMAESGMRTGLEQFAVVMCETRRSLTHAALLPEPEQKRMWRLDAASRYCNGMIALDVLLGAGAARSTALCSFSRWLHALVDSDIFQAFAGACDVVSGRMRRIRYTLCCSENALHVGRAKESVTMDTAGPVKADPAKTVGGKACNGSQAIGRAAAASLCGDNLVDSIRRTFETFAPMPPPESISFFTNLEMGALELQILAHLRPLYPDAFDALAAWDRTAMPFPHPGVEQFDRELRFYLAWYRLADALTPLTCPLTLPVVAEDAPLCLHGLYDLALALKRRQPVVPNDCLLSGHERLMVLTGPNQGGKSTFARALGQSAWLSMLGAPVPAREAALGRFDAVLTHFATAEDPDSAAGRLQDELLRIRSLFRTASGKSLVLFNELFSTTATQDAIDLGRSVLTQIRSIGSHCLYVTHLAELADPEAGIVSLVAAIGSDPGETRTFRILRRPADGKAYADSLAARYGLNREQVRQRMARNGSGVEQARPPTVRIGSAMQREMVPGSTSLPLGGVS